MQIDTCDFRESVYVQYLDAHMPACPDNSAAGQVAQGSADVNRRQADEIAKNALVHGDLESAIL